MVQTRIVIARLQQPKLNFKKFVVWPGQSFSPDIVDPKSAGFRLPRILSQKSPRQRPRAESETPTQAKIIWRCSLSVVF